MANFRTLDDLDVKGKRVLVRADLNVPMKDGIVTDSSRIDRQAPTISELAEKGARVIVCSHFDRPKGKVVPSMSLGPVAEPLATSVGRPVAFASDCVGQSRRRRGRQAEGRRCSAVGKHALPRRRRKERSGLRQGARQAGATFMSMTHFPAAHRAHCSTEGVAHLLPSAAGRSMEAELTHLQKALNDPERPLMAVIGGAKVSSKIALLENLVKRVETLVIGGAMANTFLAAEGVAVGKSLYEADHLETARKVIKLSTESGAAILLPTDVVVAKEFKANAAHRTVPVRQVAKDEMILDVGPATVVEFGKFLHNTRTLVWNGPLGAFETPPFDEGTVAAARLVAGAPKQDCCSRWQAAVIRFPPSIMPMWPTISPMSRRRAAPSWNGWKDLELPGVAALMVK